MFNIFALVVKSVIIAISFIKSMKFVFRILFQSLFFQVKFERYAIIYGEDAPMPPSLKKPETTKGIKYFDQ